MKGELKFHNILIIISSFRQSFLYLLSFYVAQYSLFRLLRRLNHIKNIYYPISNFFFCSFFHVVLVSQNTCSVMIPDLIPHSEQLTSVETTKTTSKSYTFYTTKAGLSWGSFYVDTLCTKNALFPPLILNNNYRQVLQVTLSLFYSCAIIYHFRIIWL